MTDTAHIQHALFELLRAGLWGQPSAALSRLSLTDEEWSLLFRTCCRQTVVGLVWQGMQFLSDAQLPPPANLVRWAAALDAVERKNRRTDNALAGLSALFSRESLHPVLQKGQGVAQFYRRPSWRESGDIDLYFSTPAAFAAATSLVRRSGADVVFRADGSAFYVWQGIEVEHHVRLVDLNNPFAYRDLLKMERTFGFRPFVLGDGRPLCMEVPSPMLNLLLLNAHILKHAVGWGVGLRQLCDMARACWVLHGETDPGAMRWICRRMGIGRWTRLLHTFLVACLGLPTACLPYADTCATAQPLLDLVLRSGNFGFSRARRHGSGLPVWRRKLYTSHSFVRNVGFSLRYAPGETFWICTRLVKGQFR